MAVVTLRRTVLAGKHQEQTSWFAPALTVLQFWMMDRRGRMIALLSILRNLRPMPMLELKRKRPGGMVF
jgi:hypothetical protein